MSTSFAFPEYQVMLGAFTSKPLQLYDYCCMLLLYYVIKGNCLRFGKLVYAGRSDGFCSLWYQIFIFRDCEAKSIATNMK